LQQTGLGHVIRPSIFTQIRASNFDLANQARWFSFGWELFSLISSDLFWLHFALPSKHRPQAHAPNLAIILFRRCQILARAQNLHFASGSTTYLINIWVLLQF
jgi:hypothetical protein